MIKIWCWIKGLIFGVLVLMTVLSTYLVYCYHDAIKKPKEETSRPNFRDYSYFKEKRGEE